MAQYEDEFPARARVSGHLRILILRLKVQSCPMLPSHPICIKNQCENNNILGVDTSELRLGGDQKLVLKLSSLNHPGGGRSCSFCNSYNIPCGESERGTLG